MYLPRLAQAPGKVPIHASYSINHTLLTSSFATELRAAPLIKMSWKSVIN